MGIINSGTLCGIKGIPDTSTAGLKEVKPITAVFRPNLFEPEKSGSNMIDGDYDSYAKSKRNKGQFHVTLSKVAHVAQVHIYPVFSEADSYESFVVRWGWSGCKPFMKPSKERVRNEKERLSDD